ncbi:FAD-dependent oxidoreductase [Castellaniella defragrans]|uniref:NAD(P)/FAD-dependent oxidoreductase n=1 Tax=Castellaniella defragrans TaxID=75697 RepID=UPI002AFF12BF|nr:FAD-dependent oxidoreductase [Castellaniella defragrans]
MAVSQAEAIVIGGGFYGTVIALYLARQRGFTRIVLLEQENRLLTHASMNNQARVHNGYHYPRSFTTAYRSRINAPRFIRDWPDAIHCDFTQLYAIARHQSKVSASQFLRFCRDIGAPVEAVDPALAGLFDSRRIEAVYRVEECALDAGQLARWATSALPAAGIEVRCGTRACAIARQPAHRLQVRMDQGGDRHALNARYVFNCGYAGLDQPGRDGTAGETGSDPAQPPLLAAGALKHELTEMALMAVPEALAQIGVTVMDGPFFSLMPFPARPGLHTLSHVRYTPHAAWFDRPGQDPYQILARYPRHSRAERMVRDAGRYLPAIAQARHVDSLFEIKTVLRKNESDDGRPILFETHPDLPGYYAILGGKIDNIYDALERLDAEPLLPGS